MVMYSTTTCHKCRAGVLWVVEYSFLSLCYQWGAVCVKIKNHVAFIFSVGIYSIHGGDLRKSPLSRCIL